MQQHSNTYSATLDHTFSPPLVAPHGVLEVLHRASYVKLLLGPLHLLNRRVPGQTHVEDTVELCLVGVFQIFRVRVALQQVACGLFDLVGTQRASKQAAQKP